MDDIAEIFSIQRLAMLPLVPEGILNLDGLEQAAADNAGAIFSITG